METGQVDQILADVKTMATDALNSDSNDVPLDEGDLKLWVDGVLRQVLLDAVRKYHQELLPFSNHGKGKHQVIFQGTVFDLVLGGQIWEPDVLELAFVPPLVEQRIDNNFGVDLPLKDSGRYSLLRIYPPRFDLMFEFQQYVIADIVQQIFGTGAEWIQSRLK